MNIQHSSRTDQWHTPIHIVEMARLVLQGIDIDPASSLKANETVRARRIITKEQDGLATEWGPGSVFLNPPGGKLRGRSLSELFWDALMKHSEVVHDFRGAIFLAFSVESLAVTQRSARPMLAYPICVPAKRIAFVPGFATAEPKHSPSHANVIVYVPGTEDRTRTFKDVFYAIGHVKA